MMNAKETRLKIAEIEKELYCVEKLHCQLWNERECLVYSLRQKKEKY